MKFESFRNFVVSFRTDEGKCLSFYKNESIDKYIDEFPKVNWPETVDAELFVDACDSRQIKAFANYFGYAKCVCPDRKDGGWTWGRKKHTLYAHRSSADPVSACELYMAGQIAKLNKKRLS
jgi:hypothetical protein